VDDTTYGGDFTAAAVFCRRQRVVVAKQLVRAVDEIDLHRVYRPTYEASAFCTSSIDWPRVNVRWIGSGVPDIQIFSSASRSKCPAVSTAK
jgi:hypothetical protein